MASTRTIAIAIAVVCLLILVSSADARKRKSRRSKRNHMTCRPRSLVRYQMTVHTTWDRETFPKMFPIYRPPAHWSQLIGRSHGNNYKMWEEGGNATLAVQKFAEKEDAEFFDLELSQGYNGVLDAFVAPTIETSVGQTSAVVSLDGRHSKVSFMLKIVPSPDWFIGLDSAELCYRGRWRKTYSRDLKPFDAGTDQGLTFTSPQWPNIPKEVISAITSSSPNHPASSFFYPDYKVLPRLGHVEFEMISEYRLRKVHKKIIPIPQPTMNDVTNVSQKTSAGVGNVFKYNEDTENVVSLSKNNKTSVPYSGITDSNKNIDKKSLFSMISTPQKKAETGSRKQEYSKTSQTKPNQHHNEPTLGMRSLPRDGTSSKRNPEESTRSFNSQEMPNSLTTKRERRVRTQKDQSNVNVQETVRQDRLEDYQKRVDCEVAQWSEWSACSQTCGFGDKQRSREVLTLPEQGGTHCPLLKEETLCGSMRNCQWKHFSLMNKKVNSPFKTLKRRIGRRRRRH